MNRDEPKSEREILRRAIEAISKRLPTGWLLEEQYDVVGANDLRADAALAIVAPDGANTRLVLEAKRVVERRDVGVIADRLESLAGIDGRPVLVAKYLTTQVRADLTEKGIGYVDATGNLLITAGQPAIFLADRGEDRDPWRGTGRPRGTLRGDPAARVARALLDFDRKWRIRDLIDTSSASTGATYRVLEYLQQEGLAERDDDGTVRVPDWRRLLEAWAEDAAFLSTNRTVKCIEPRGTEAFLGKLRETKSMRYAVTSSAAAAEWAPYAPARVIYVYVDSVEEASKEWNLRSSESSPNVILVEPRKPNDVAFDRVAESQRGFAIAAPAQVAVDLWNGPGRNPSEAQELLAWMSANESEWRK